MGWWLVVEVGVLREICVEVRKGEWVGWMEEVGEGGVRGVVFWVGCGGERRNRKKRLGGEGGLSRREKGRVVGGEGMGIVGKDLLRFGVGREGWGE